MQCPIVGLLGCSGTAATATTTSTSLLLLLLLLPLLLLLLLLPIIILGAVYRHRPHLCRPLYNAGSTLATHLYWISSCISPMSHGQSKKLNALRLHGANASIPGQRHNMLLDSTRYHHAGRVSYKSLRRTSETSPSPGIVRRILQSSPSSRLQNSLGLSLLTTVPRGRKYRGPIPTRGVIHFQTATHGTPVKNACDRNIPQLAKTSATTLQLIKLIYRPFHPSNSQLTYLKQFRKTSRTTQ